MKRSIIGTGMILVLLGLLLTGCGDKEKETGIANKSSKASTEKSGEASDAVKRHIMKDLDQVTESCLNTSNKANSYDYSLDESFFLWFYSKYGQSLYRKLEQGLKKGEDAQIYRRLTGQTLHTLWIYYCADCGVHTEDLDHVYVMNSKNSTDVVMDFAGDVNFDQSWPNIQYMDEKKKSIKDCFSENLVKEMRDADLLMLNNEFTYGTGGTPLAGKTYTFQAKPKRAEMLQELGVDIVSLANNHAYDYGQEGLLETMKVLDDYKVPYVGAGKNLEEASKISYFIINGKKIAITSATQIERTLQFTKEATETTPGVLKTLHPKKYVKVIQEAREHADYVIVYVHWGTEGNSYFGGDQSALARTFVDAGADVIIGNHTHCLQGIQYYKGVPIYYSLGNFWFDWNEPNAPATGLAQIVIHEDMTVDYSFLPCYYKNYKTSMLKSKKSIQKAYEHMNKISNGAKIDNDGHLINSENSAHNYNN
ncbi:MAG: CapA family protein [Lachnospiraceae bacterium]|nr:CapA family protein [Lachnospiraceae bacterium]